MATKHSRVALADLSIFPATAEQTRESRTRHAALWCHGRSLEEYLLRDEVMDADEHAANGNLITWVLAPRKDPTTLDFMCSCETFRRAALVARPAKALSQSPASESRGDDTPSESAAQATRVHNVTAYGIASVYTPPPNRKKGYAQHMMRLLHWVLAPRTSPVLPPTFPPAWGAPPCPPTGFANAAFSVLYSDIGREFYRSCGPDPDARNGWVVSGALETSWALDSKSDSDTPTAAAAEKNSTLPLLLPVEPERAVRLSEADLTALYAHDARWIRADLLRNATSAAGKTGRTQFTFLPDRGVGAFVVRRTMSFAPDSASQLHPILPSTQWGAAILPAGAQTLADALSSPSPSSSPLPLPFVTWTLDIRTSPRTLVVSRLRVDARTFPTLLDVLRAAAREEGVEKVEFWYMPPGLRALAEAKGWRTREREEHLSAVKWYGGEREEELEWVYNEKFCWC